MPDNNQVAQGIKVGRWCAMFRRLKAWVAQWRKCADGDHRPGLAYHNGEYWPRSGMPVVARLCGHCGLEIIEDDPTPQRPVDVETVAQAAKQRRQYNGVAQPNPYDQGTFEHNRFETVYNGG